MTKAIDEFNQYREEMNERILGSDHLGIKRFFALDHQAYEGGALDSKTKELLGLIASLVLRCDDCITYHVLQCIEQGVKREEFLDTFNVALVVGGSITSPTCAARLNGWMRRLRHEKPRHSEAAKEPVYAKTRRHIAAPS